MNLFGPPTCFYLAFDSHLRSKTSPAEPEAGDIWRTLTDNHIDPAVALGMFEHESACGTKGRATANKSWGNLRWKVLSDGSEPYLSLPYPVQNVDGFCAYPLWKLGARHYAEHLAGLDGTNFYLGRGLTTVEQIIPVWAPAADGNTPDAYIADVEATALALGTLLPPMPIGAITVTDRRPIPGSNYMQGRQTGYRFIVLHTMVGSIEAADASFHNPARIASAHLGLAWDGRVWLWVDDGDSCYAQGNLRDHNFGANADGYAIEHEDQWPRNPDGSLGPEPTRPDPLYGLSARVVHDKCHSFGIPIRRGRYPDLPGVIRHDECPGAQTACPDHLDVERIVREALAVDGTPPQPDIKTLVAAELRRLADRLEGLGVST